MPSQASVQTWDFMELRDLFGDGDVSGDLVRSACLGLSCEHAYGCDQCASRFDESGCGTTGSAGTRVLEVDSGALGLPRDLVRSAILDGADIVLSFVRGAVPADRMQREIASLVRHLRNTGTSLSIEGLSNSVRARIARLEASLGRS